MFTLIASEDKKLIPTFTVSGTDSLIDLLTHNGKIHDVLYEALEQHDVTHDERIYLMERIELQHVITNGVASPVATWRYDVVYTGENFDINTLRIEGDDGVVYQQDPIGQQWTFSAGVRYNILCLDMLSNHYWASCEGMTLLSSEDTMTYVESLRDLNGLP